MNSRLLLPTPRHGSNGRVLVKAIANPYLDNAEIITASVATIF